jgi:ATP-dependent Clp protease adapter protein ClpS
MTRKRPKIGDRIIFKAATRFSHRKATRVVKRVHANGSCEVGYSGWSDFVVRRAEILDVLRKGAR